MINNKRISMSEKELERLPIMNQLLEKRISQAEASLKLEVSIRQIRRLLYNYRQQGAKGLISRKRGGNRGFKEDFKQEIILIVKTNYHDFGPSFASEKLRENNNLIINRETLRQWMIEEQLWVGTKLKQAKIHQTRERRSCYGELIQIDGSHHNWFEGRAPKCCLIVFIDDATGKIMELRFSDTETTKAYFNCIHNYINNHGIPVTFYSDKAGIFTVNKVNKDEEIKYETQFARVMNDLKIEMILAHSPQAKGRVERANCTLQDRLVKEMRLRKISNMEGGNKYLPEFIKSFNSKFAVIAKNDKDAHRKLEADKLLKIDEILSIKNSRKLSKNLEFSYNNTIYQVNKVKSSCSLRFAQVDILELMDGKIVIKKDSQYLKYRTIKKSVSAIKTADSKEINSMIDQIIIANSISNFRELMVGI